jgi:hypothetical protein
MSISNIFQCKLLGLPLKQSNHGCGYLFYVACTILMLTFTNKSFAQEQNPSEKSSGNSISDILNKVVGEKSSDPKDNQGGNSISKIVSSLVKKNGEPSLMFSDDELTKIDQALEAHRNNQPFDAKPAETKTEEKEAVTAGGEVNSCIYLESILYHSPNNWSAWVNGQKISSKNNKDTNEIYIKSIDADNAEIIWTMSISKWKILTNQTSENGAPINSNNQVEVNFNLSFNQTYMLTGGKIIEGRIQDNSSTAEEAWGHSKKLTDAIGKATE